LGVVHRFSHNHRVLFLIVLFLVPISQFALDIYSPSLPRIVSFFHATDSQSQNTITIFLFAIGLGQFLFGVLADSFGRKTSLVSGMFLFSLSSYLCYQSGSIFSLTSYRFLQGMACASIAVLSKTIVVDIYDGIDLMKSSAWIGLIWGSSPIIAPVIGGYFDHYGGWRLSFLFLLVYGLVSLFLCLFLFKETIPKFQKFRGKLVFIKSIYILKNKDFLCSTLIIAATNLGLFVFNLMGPFFIQVIMRRTSIFYGYMALIVGFVYIIGASASRFVIKYFEAKIVTKQTVTLLLMIGLSALISSFFWPKSIFLLMLISSSIAFVSGFLYPYLVFFMFSPFQNLSGMVSSNYGIISYGFSASFAAVLSMIHITSLKEIAFAYFIVSLISFICMKVMLVGK
jgi:MFS family permease